MYHHHLLAFSVGVLMVTLYSVTCEGLEHFEATPLYFYAGACVGVALLFLLTRIHAHHHHTGEHDHHAHTHTKLDGSHVLIADTVHNVSDGLILYPAFVAGPHVGLAMTFGIAVHEVIEEIAEYFVYREAGYTNAQALVRNFVSGLSIFVGIGLAAFASSTEWLEPWLYALASGSFAYLIFVDLIPCVFFYHKSMRTIAPLVIMTATGALLMLGVSALVPHMH
jgi:zinc transporter ZupT